MITFQIDPLYESLVNTHVLETAALAVLEHLPHPLNPALTIVITGDETLHELNLSYLGVDAPTDVLSFPSGDLDPDTGESYLGDILISHPRAAEQASQGGHAMEAEMQLLVVHGTLHLLGYDHGEPEEKAEMWQVQGEILAKIGCPLSPP